MLPDTVNNIRALRLCCAKDFSTDNRRKRWSEFSRLMGMIQGQGDLMRNPTLGQVDELFSVWEQQVDIDPVTPKGRVRRVGDLKWTTVHKLVTS
jgi:hypothetical protein